MMRWLVRVILALTLVAAAALLGQSLIRPVSTPMLARWLTRQPVDRRWIPLSAVSPRLIAAVILSEDGQFCRHHGVDLSALREVIEKRGPPSRGASTLTMQVAKNLFLWPGRSYLRKALEIPIAVILDAAWGKKRVLETYFNIAEWGDGIFGAEAAAERDFGKPAASLSSYEAGLMASALPNPILRSVAHPTRRHRLLASRLVEMQDLAPSHVGCVEPAISTRNGAAVD